MVALNSGSLDALPSPLNSIEKLASAVGVLDSNMDRLNRASLGRDSLFFEVMKKSSSFELDLTKQNNLLILAESASALTFTLTEVLNSRVGMNVIILDYTGNSETYNITIDRNGNTIDDAASNITIAKNKGYIWLHCSESGKWVTTTKDIDKNLCVGLSNTYNATFQHRILAQGIVASISTGNAGGEFYGISSRSSLDTPSAISSGESMCNVRGVAYNGSAFATGARIALQPSQTWEPTKQGTQISFFNTPNDSTTIATTFQFQNNKNAVFYGGLRVNTNNTHDAFTASAAPANTYSVNAVTVTSDPRLKDSIQKFLLDEELLDKLIESECFISWTWKNFENEEIFIYEKQIITDPETKEEREIEVPILTQSHYKSNHKRRHCGSNAFKILKVLIEMNISTEDFPIVSIENYNPEMIDLIKNMTEKEFMNTPESLIGRLSVRNELYIPLLANVAHRQGQKLKAVEARLQVIENTLNIGN